MDDDEIPQVSDGTNINDSRLPGDFSGTTFSKYKKLKSIKSKLVLIVYLML